MSRIALIIAILLAQSPPAAACHRFHDWRFPYPQRCGTGAALVRTAARQVPAQPSTPISDDEARALAIETLKVQMQKKEARQ